jgi:hypothetical protein
MNQHSFETNWARLRPRVQQRWPQLPEQDVRRIDGRVEQLYRLLWSRGGLSRSDAARELWEFLHNSACGETACRS